MRLIFPIARHARTLTRITVSLGLISSAHLPAISAQTVATRAAVRGPGAVLSFDTAQLRGLKYRMIGPARGGRVTTVTGVPQEPLTFYMGSTGGGVWKTANGGLSWSNVSDGWFEAASMGKCAAFRRLHQS